MGNCNIFFSIIIPVYNAEKYLADAIESVLNQTFQAWELILVNDGSEDESFTICNKYAKNDSRICIINQQNKGVSAARNQGINYAQGDWIIFLDADDWLENSYLHEVRHMLDTKDVTDLIVCNYFSVLNNEKKCRKKITQTSIGKEKIGTLIEASLRMSQWHGHEWYGNLRTVWGKCFRSSIIKTNNISFDSRLRIGEDMLFLLEVIQKVNKILFLDKPLYNYRINDESVMQHISWKGSEQGIIYFEKVEEVVGSSVPEGAMADLWLETAERDWETIHKTNFSPKKKYLLFRELLNNYLYKRFSRKNSYSYSSHKQRLYTFFIRHKYIIMLMALSYMRMKNQEYKLKKEIKNE